MANNINANQRIDAISVSGKIHTIAPFHGTAAEWENNSLYIPAQGEIIIYDVDDNNDKSKFKIGDGETTVANLPFFTCDNGGDEKEMYGVDANKSGNVELFFGIKPLPTFSIVDCYGIGEPFPDYGATLVFEFEDGMTWAEWINSSYSDNALASLEGDYVKISWGYLFTGNWSSVYGFDFINAGEQYNVSN